MKLKQYVWRPEYLIIAVATALVAFYNLALWKKIIAVSHPEGLHGLFFLMSVAFLLAAFFSTVLALLPFRWVTRPLLTLVLPLASLTTYFMNQYGVAIDARMIQNVFETDFAESLALLTFKMVVYFLLLGVLPVVLLWRAPVLRLAAWPATRARLLLIAGSLLVIALVAMFFYQSFASVLRNNRDVRYYVVPNNYLKGMLDYFHDSSEAPVVLEKIGTDAHKGPSWEGRQRKSLVVLVIGETARAANFSLASGYARDTNPELRQQADIVSFSKAHSCGTETAVSLPCMLSGLGRSNYSLSKARSRENLLDVVQRAGVAVLWLENQSGCKRTCDRVTVRINTTDMKLPEFCSSGECHDEILIAQLREYAAKADKDTLVVMHQMGSHGPAYYLRYPPAFERFTPVCKTNLLDKCTPAQITNTYDNTILYTDHVLSSVIDTLKTYHGRFDTGMIYMSDHGESLGEYGLYLHGAPYVLAPEFQKHIPAVMWLSADMQAARGINVACVAKEKDDAVSHDNLFHSVLGLLDIRTSLYQPDLDLFSRCQTAAKH